MRVTFWGTRGSIATPGPETVRYGGDTSCVTIEGPATDHVLVLDAGTGIRPLGAALRPEVRHIDLFLSHLHLDHLVGLGFFAPMFRPGVRLTIWGPPSETSLLDRLGRYLSPPLFPVRLRDVAADVELRDTPANVEVAGFRVTSAPVIHPDPALGFRIEGDGRVVAYLPDHEPALGPDFPSDPAWTSGTDLANGADLLIHDAQYTAAEYVDRVGWGHSSVDDAIALAELAHVRALMLFHHDPARTDTALDAVLEEGRRSSRAVEIDAARQGQVIDLRPSTPGSGTYWASRP